MEKTASLRSTHGHPVPMGNGFHAGDPSSGLAAKARACLEAAIQRLLYDQTGAGYWEGEVASSPFATALCLIALALGDPNRFRDHLHRGIAWLQSRQNLDGGWGDTDRSPSNLPSTTLSFLALKLAPRNTPEDCLWRAQSCLKNFGGFAAIEAHYGQDRTFAIPIKTLCSLAGLTAWDARDAFPFEAVLLPPLLIRLMRLPVVSFAIPALIAVGILQHTRNPTRVPWRRKLRHLAVPRSLALLRALQPPNGAFLASPIATSMVVICLMASGMAPSMDLRKSLDFLGAVQRSDGSWSIVTNLSVWNTTLAVQSFLAAGIAPASGRLPQTAIWLAEQYRETKEPVSRTWSAGWSWTHQAGGLIDADDTAGVTLALKQLQTDRGTPLITRSRNWLLALQNRDGGWPTFSQGGGTQVFDRSCVDISCHVLKLLVLSGVKPDAPPVARGLAYLHRQRQPDGSWPSLWSGNEFAGYRANPLYGTYKVLDLLCCLPGLESRAARWKGGLDWIISRQNSDGGWGQGQDGGSGPEETAMGVMALLSLKESPQPEALTKGIAWLVSRQHPDGSWDPTPIGLYCDSLYYYERMYALAFPCLALARFLGGPIRQTLR